MTRQEVANFTLPDWQEGRVEDFFELKRGHDLPVQSRNSGNYPIIGSNGVVGFHDEAISEDEGVITGRSGTLGKVYFSESAYWPLNTALYISDFKGNHAKYCYYFLSYFPLAAFGTGTGVPTLNRNIVHKQKVKFPPLLEQPKIESILSLADKKINLIEKKTSETLQLKKGLMQKLFTEGVGKVDDEGKWQSHKNFDPDIGCPDSWIKKELLGFFELKRGYDLPVQDRMSGEIPIIGSNGLVGWHTESMSIGPGVITGRSGTIGKIYFSEGEFWPLNTSLYIVDFKGNDEKFCYYFLQMVNLVKFSTGTGVPTLNRNILHKQSVSFPLIEEQQKIAEILTKVDEKIDILNQQKAEAQQLKKGLMQKLLTGEWRVPLDGQAA